MRILENARRVADKSLHVKCDLEGIKKAATLIYHQMQESNYSFATWKQHPLNPKDCTPATTNWIFLVDLLNFSFYSDKSKDEQYAVTFQGVRYTGYWTLCACINRALGAGIPITSPSFYANITREQLLDIFRADPGCKEQIPLFDERLEIMRSAGKTLCEKFDGSFVNCISKCEESAQTLLQIIADNFSSFRDEHIYKPDGQVVHIYKRAQILIADIWACFAGQGLGSFRDIHSITMFADYRVPQCLVGLGLIKYSDELMATLEDPKHSLESGDEREIEIRCCSIWAVELLRVEIENILQPDDKPPNAIMLDFFLWDYAKQHAKELVHIPIHRTRSHFY